MRDNNNPHPEYHRFPGDDEYAWLGLLICALTAVLFVACLIWLVT